MRLRWLYIGAAITFYVKMLVMANTAPGPSFPIVEAIFKDAGVPNVVAGIILRNRLYDTIFEVIVFTLAIMGVRFLLANEKLVSQIHQFTDPSTILLARLGATIAAMVGVELALRGHLSPGGGFAAGVAIGTAIGLVTMTSSPDNMEILYQRWQVSTLEKISVLLFILLAVLSLTTAHLPLDQSWLGQYLKDSLIPLLNILVAVKVALGSWAVVLLFIRYRGLL
ncbi:MAG: Na(+)/H(+) antiporter subunit B [Cyanobacteriota bacterium]|nr:Na(+)/H(+) antiporter subunit B [Cyanobacteriota bacterium]